MEMDLSNVIIGVVSVIICALPFIMMNKSKNKREKKFLDVLSNIATQNNCKIDQMEVFGNFAIGLDKTKKSILFCRQSKEQMKEQFIDCKSIKTCKVNKTIVTTNNIDTIDKLELILMSNSRDKQEVRLVFYRSSVSAQLYGELQAIHKWSELINLQLLS